MAEHAAAVIVKVENCAQSRCRSTDTAGSAPSVVLYAREEEQLRGGLGSAALSLLTHFGTREFSLSYV